MLHKYFTLIFGCLLILPALVYCQDSTFHIDLIATIQAPENRNFSSVLVEDMDWDGKLDIVYSAMVRGRNHAIGIIDDGEHVFQSESRFQYPSHLLMINDFNDDGFRDIAIEAAVWNTFEVYGGPDFELIFEKDNALDQNFISQSGEYYNHNGDRIPVFLCNETHAVGGGSWSIRYRGWNVICGSPVMGNIELISQIGLNGNIKIQSRNNEEGFDYFNVGQTIWSYEYERPDSTYIEEWLYWILFTSY